MYAMKDGNSPRPRVEATLAPLKGASYVGASLAEAFMAPQREAWMEAMGERGGTLQEARRERDGGLRGHVTFLTPPETRRLKKAGRLPEVWPTFSLEALGVGRVENAEGHEAWFVVFSSPEAQVWRASLGLAAHDLHATLGFSPRDLHGVRKDATSIVMAVAAS